MIFSPFYYFKTGCAAYVFGCGGLGIGAVVDPRADDVDSYLMMSILRENQGRSGS